MIAAESIFSVQLIYALGWTLIHTLWQGLLVASSLFVVESLLRQKPARVRHAVAGAAMALVFVLAVTTFAAYYLDNRAPEAFTTSTRLPASEVVFGQPAASDGPEVAGAAFIPEQYFVLLVRLWLVGLLLFSLRLAGGLAYVYRLKRNATYALDGYWQDRLRTFLGQLKVDRPVALLASTMVKVPLVIGHFKPVILVPTTALTGLPAAELEAILLHELGHIRRNDYLWNLLQSLGEVLFFYHPGVWWITSRIRTLREHCCDDMAVAVTGDPMTFAKALTNLEEVTMTPHFAVAANGGKKKLFSRIKRLFTGNKPQRQRRGGPALACLLVFFMLVSSMVLTQATMMRSPGVDQGERIHELARQTFGDKKTGTITIVENGEELAVVMRRGRVTGFFIDGQPHELDRLENYLDRFVEHRDLHEKLRREQGELKREAVEMKRRQAALKERAAAVAKVRNEGLAAEKRELARVKREIEARLEGVEHREAKALRAEAEAREQEERAGIEAELNEHEQQLSEQAETLKRRLEQNHEKMEMARVSAREMKEQQERMAADVHQQQQKLERVHAELEEKQFALEQRRRAMAELNQAVLKSLLADGLVSEGDEWTLRLSVDYQVLYLNGVQQEQAVYKKYLGLVNAHLGTMYTGEISLGPC